jgi:hypothetical protein
MRVVLVVCFLALGWGSKIDKEEEVKLGLVARTIVHDVEQVGRVLLQ